MTQEEKLEEAKRLYKTANADQKYVLERLFPELKESEDEKIKQELIEYHKAQAFLNGKPNNKHVKFVAWIEKQGEQKAICRNNDTTIDGELNNYCCKIYNALHKENGGKLSFARLQNMAMDIYQWCNEQKQGEHKPVEWSEEDNEHIQSILERLDGMCKKNDTFVRTRFAISDDEDWLKSIKPQSQWKPSEEQLKALQGVYDWYMSHYPQNKEFESLFDDLLKL